MATISPTVTVTQIYTAGGGTTTNYSGYVGYSGTSTTLYSCRLAFTPSKNCTQMVLGISAKAAGSGIYESRVNFRAAVYTSAKYPTSVNWAGDTPSVGSVQSFAMSTASSGKTTTGSVTITGAFTAGTTYYLLVWHYTSQQEFFYNAEWTLTGTVQTYTVSYNANGGSGAPSAQTKTYGTALTLSSTKPTRSNGSGSNRTLTYNGNGGTAGRASDTVTPVRTYIFSKWNTQSGGGGTDYNPGGSYTANAAAILYAQWNYSDNNPTVTLPTATRTGYDFKGWSTSSSASSGAAAGSSYAVTATDTLYATWAEKTYAVSYNANGGSGAPSAQTKYYFTDLTLSSTRPTRTGYTFKGWATSSTATSAAYQPGGSYTTNAAVTLYAVWQENTFTVSYNGNKPHTSSTVSNLPASQTKYYTTNLTLSSTRPTASTVTNATYTVTYNGSGGTPGRASDTATKTTAYTFSKWNTKADGSGTNYNPGASFTANAATTLYARWASSTTTTTVTLPSATRSGFTFLGWATTQGGAVAYQAGDTITPTGNTTLYAVWDANGLVNIYGTGWDSYQIWIYNGSSWDMYVAWVYNGSGWDQCQ